VACTYYLAVVAALGILFEFPCVVARPVDEHALADDVVRFIPKFDSEDGVCLRLIRAPVEGIPEPFGADDGAFE